MTYFHNPSIFTIEQITKLKVTISSCDHTDFKAYYRFVLQLHTEDNLPSHTLKMITLCDSKLLGTVCRASIGHTLNEFGYYRKQFYSVVVQTVSQ